MPTHTLSMTAIADLRKSYELAELDEQACEVSPFEQFTKWLNEAIAAGVPEPNSMTLATVGKDMQPSTRIVLIKGFDTRGITWYTNYNSRKGQELNSNALAALQFHWVELERVVRIEGVVSVISTKESDTYYQSRPLDSKIGAWASPQSEVIANREILVRNAAQYKENFSDNPPRPKHWGGYRLFPKRWEFWQGRKSRLHDRLLYLPEENETNMKETIVSWSRQRLAP